ncbi:hypothetical protein KAJ27_03635, partial [bacterium]|nr:hypothetical protein [bacterium]
QTYWFLPESRMKVRIHTIIKELNNTLFDKMLDPENLPFYKNNKLSFLKKGFHVRLKLMSSDQSTVKLLLVPFLKIGMLSQIAPSRNAIMSNFCANKYYRTTSSFGNIPLYSISSRERHGFRNSSLASLIQLDGSIKPSLLYVQPATAKPYDISRKRIPLKSKIDLVVGVE